MKLLIAALWSMLALASAAPALAQSPGDGGGEASSPASGDQYGEIPSSESAADAARFAVSQASEASKAFEQARAAAKSVGVDDETASAIAAEAVAARSEGESEGGSARAAPDGRLPDTGGAPLLVVSVVAVLIWGGLVAGRVIR